MKLYLIRHTSVAVPAGFAYGQTDVPLKETFEIEAAAVKQRLEGINIERVWTSPLSRCTRLADYCGYPNAIRDDRLKEINFGEWEMKSWDEISNDPRSEAWFKDWQKVATPGGESLEDQYQRVSHFLDEVRQSGLRSACLFAHGGILTCARVYIGEYDLVEAFKQVPSYGEMIEIEI